MIETNNKEIKSLPKASPLGLNDILASPEKIPDISCDYRVPEVINSKEWELIYEVMGKLKPLMERSQELDAQLPEELYTLEMEADNGVFFSFQNKKDERETLTVYLSSFGIESSDWGPGLRIPKNRVKCHRLQLISRRKIVENVYVASSFSFRVTSDFKIIEGDPQMKKDLEAKGMFSDNNTFLFATKFHLLYIEVLDPESNIKALTPLVADVKDLLRLTLEAQKDKQFKDVLRVCLTGKTTEEDWELMKPALVGLGETTAIDLEKLMEIGRSIAQDTITGSMAKMRAAPVSLDYLRDLIGNIENLEPRKIDHEVLIPEELDLTSQLRERYLQKRAQKKLRQWPRKNASFYSSFSLLD